MGGARDIKDFLSMFSQANIKKVQDLGSDIRVLMADEFDKNFDREAFFHKPWKPSQRVIKKGGKTLQDRSHLRKSFRSTNDTKKIVFFSNRKDATLHNEGGTTHPRVTAKMKRWAWAMHKETGAPMYKALAMTKKKRLTIKIPQRQIIGEHPALNTKVDLICQHTLAKLFVK